tara:strand:- start:275 stop:703 length:429 start_codon:yes stop_codon:yes gene_type:complete
MYLTLKALHLIAVISWMVGLLYLPRIFVYHADVKTDSETYNIFTTMELRLMRYIMNPAMIATWIFGIWLVYLAGHEIAMQLWMQIKLILVILLSGFHGFLSKCRKNFYNKVNSKSPKFYRIINEVPTVILIIIVFLVIFMPN